MLRIRALYPGFWFLPIPDPTRETKEEGIKKFIVLPIATNMTKLKTNFSKIGIEWWYIFPKKMPLSSQKYGFGIRGSRGKKTVSRCGSGSGLESRTNGLIFIWKIYLNVGLLFSPALLTFSVPCMECSGSKDLSVVALALLHMIVMFKSVWRFSLLQYTSVQNILLWTYLNLLMHTSSKVLREMSSVLGGVA